MSKSTLKVQGILAGLFAAIVLSGCDYMEPVVPQVHSVASAASDSAIDTPDHP